MVNVVDCTFSDLDEGWCIEHSCYGSDPEHPHVWQHCTKKGCPECAKLGVNGG